MQISEKGLSAGRATKYAGNRVKPLSSIMISWLGRGSSKPGWGLWGFQVRPVTSKHRLCWLLGKQKNRFCLKCESFWGNGICSVGKNQELALSLSGFLTLLQVCTNSSALQSLCALKVEMDGHLCQNLSEMQSTLQSKTSSTLWMCEIKNGRRHSVICSSKPTRCCLDKKQLSSEEDLELEFMSWDGILNEELVVTFIARIEKTY